MAVRVAVPWEPACMYSRAMRKLTLALAVLALGSVCCGGAPAAPAQSPGAGGSPSASEVKAATHACGAADSVQRHDLSGEGSPTEALVPCSKNGANDYSGAIKIETIPEGIHITINATDDEVNAGMLGSDVKTRDAVIVYTKGKTSKAIEVPLVKTKDA